MDPADPHSADPRTGTDTRRAQAECGRCQRRVASVDHGPEAPGEPGRPRRARASAGVAAQGGDVARQQARRPARVGGRQTGRGSRARRCPPSASGHPGAAVPCGGRAQATAVIGPSGHPTSPQPRRIVVGGGEHGASSPGRRRRTAPPSRGAGAGRSGRRPPRPTAAPCGHRRRSPARPRPGRRRRTPPPPRGAGARSE